MVVKTKYVDVNIFVYWLGKHPVFGETARQWIKDIESAVQGEYVTSSLTIYEVLVIVAGLSGRGLDDIEFVSDMLEAFTGLRELVIERLDIGDFNMALSLMKRYGLDLENAIHAANSLRLEVKEFVSNDEYFDKTPLRRVF